jgi:IS5 family transposase
MVGLLLLMQISYIYDEIVFEQRSENFYFQYFCGEISFKLRVHYKASEIANFRKRIGIRH